MAGQEQLEQVVLKLVEAAAAASAYWHGTVAEITASELNRGINHAKEMMRNTWKHASNSSSI